MRQEVMMDMPVTENLDTLLIASRYYEGPYSTERSINV